MKFKAIAFCFAFLTLCASTQLVLARDSINSGKPALRIDFRKSGGPLSAVRFAKLGFIENSTLALLFYEAEKTNQKSSLLAHRLWLVTVDTTTGQVKASLDLGIQPTITARLFVNADNQLLAAIEKELVVFSPELKPLKNRSFANPVLLIHFSPDRKRILLPDLSEGSKTRYEHIDAGTLETFADWTENGHFVWSYSGTFLSDIEPSKASGAFSIRKPSEDWRPLQVPTNPQCHSYPEFAAEELIIQDDCDGNIFWVDAESGTWTKTTIGKRHRSLTHLLPSRDGKRFAATLVFWKFLWVPFEGHGRFTWREGVQVYDVSTRQLIFSKKLDVAWLLGREHEGGAALSADGSRLAILNRGILEVYELPLPLSAK